MYDTLDNGYDGIQVKCFDCLLRQYERGEILPIEEAGLPSDCILATKYFFDEKEDINKYVYILIKNKKYINWFTNLKQIKGDFLIYEDIYYPLVKESKYRWLIPNKYKKQFK